MKNGLALAVALPVLICLPQAADGGWRVEIVDPGPNVGGYSSLALDSDGRPCVSYHDEAAGTLKLACRLGSDLWDSNENEVPDVETPVGYFSSLAIDDTGVVHIAYRRGSTVLSVLKHAQRIGDVWSMETVDTQAQGVGHFISLALDSVGYPHIAHLKRWGQHTVKYARWTGSTWETQTLARPDGDYLPTATALAMDVDTPLVAFQGIGEDADLSFSRLPGRKWKTEIIDPDGDGESVSLVLADNGTRHVVYSTYNWVGEPFYLQYAFWTEADGWTPASTIDQSSVEPFDFASLALAPNNGDLHLSYYDRENGALKYAIKNPGGSWGSPDTVDASGDVGISSSIAVDGWGTPHITYFDAINGSLRYAVFSESCSSPGDCEDANECTLDECTDQCQNTPLADGTSCNLGLCCGGSCTTVCSYDVDCDDGEAATDDSCINGGTCAAYCEHESNGLCEAFFDKRSCNADPNCRWDNRGKVCIPG